MEKKQKLELTWIGKYEKPRLEPRILIEEPALSYHANKRFNEKDIFNNIIIQGDNLLALKALEQDYVGKVKCVYIDPPYNTGNAFEHYDDGLEHSIWLGLLRDRVEIIHKLLSVDGTLWISVDDNESHYAKVLCDELFGRSNFIANIVWEKKHTRANDAKFFSDNHDHILCFAKNKDQFKRNLLPRPQSLSDGYKNIDNDPRGPWSSQPLQVKTPSKSGIYTIVTPAGRKIEPPSGRSWGVNEMRYKELVEDNRIWFGATGDNVPRVKAFLSEVQNGLTPVTIWPHEEVGHNQDAKSEAKKLNPDNVFGTPKPEKLIERIINISSNPGDLVLDSFGGSGTTAAVAHKMRRSWITVEIGEHAETHIAPRLKKVINAEDQGGITESVSWKGGGGFRYYKLAPSLLEKDKWGQWVINKEYNANMLASAICKHEGFVYNPNETEWWNHGHSTENDFIYITTQIMTEDQLLALSEDVGTNRTLLVCCSAFKVSSDLLNNKLSNLTLKKIPNTVMAKCEWGKDDYSLNISNLPQAEPEEVIEKVKSSKNDKTANLFNEED